MSGFLDKAKDLAEDVAEKVEPLIDKLEGKLPESVKAKVEPVLDKIKDMLPGDKSDKAGAADGAATTEESHAGDTKVGDTEPLA